MSLRNSHSHPRPRTWQIIQFQLLLHFHDALVHLFNEGSGFMCKPWFFTTPFVSCRDKNNQNLTPYRVLFTNHKYQDDLVKELFKLSGVQETLRAQQLTLEQFDRLCQSYDTLCNNVRSSSLEFNNNRTEQLVRNIKF